MFTCRTNLPEHFELSEDIIDNIAKEIITLGVKKDAESSCICESVNTEASRKRHLNLCTNRTFQKLCKTK